MLVHFVTAGFIFVLLTSYAKIASTEPCDDLPCHKYGTCNNTSDGKCACIYALHKGPNCSDIDECINNHKDPCGHRGVCYNTEGGFNCTCNDGWAGVHCENQTGSNASCMYGYIGDNCDKTVSCEHGYKENITNSTERCICNPGWNQKNYNDPCNVDIDECNPQNPCLNGGICINTNGSYNCDCVQPWGNRHCDKNKTEVTTTPFSTSIQTSTSISITTETHRNISILETTTTEGSSSISETTTTEGSTSISDTKGPGAGLAAGLSVGGVAIIAVVVVFLVLKFKYKYTASDILFCKLKRHKIADIHMKSDSPETFRELEDTTVNEQAQINTNK